MTMTTGYLWLVRRLSSVLVLLFVVVTVWTMMASRLLSVGSPPVPRPSSDRHEERDASVSSQNRALTYINRPLGLSSAPEQEARRQRLQRACADKTEGNTMNILVHERKQSLRMAYCVVPKAGCTFWIRIFRYLNNDTGGRAVESPWQLGRLQAHDSSRRQMKMFRLQDPADRQLLMSDLTTRFMVARDPYSRLWSAYVDKLLLPGFWETAGRQIVARRPNPSPSSRECGHDVTFREFVELIVDQSERSGSGSLDGHWRPIQYVCDPCQFKPDFIAKQETFMEDTQAILSHLGLQGLLEGYDTSARRLDEVSILTDYYIPLQRTRSNKCSSPLLIAHRLWEAFQLNGLLPPSSKNASEALEALGNGNGDPRTMTMTRKGFKRLVLEEQERHWEELQQAATVRHHRRQAMVSRYRELPSRLLERLRAIYSRDFLYFGYEERPRDIFGGSGGG